MKVDDIKKVSVVGAGTMGNGICHQFALSGYEVTLIDTDQISATVCPRARPPIRWSARWRLRNP